MLRSKKLIALAAGFVSAIAAAGFAQVPASPARQAGQTLVIGEATVDWILKSDVSAQSDGVVEKIELDIGKTADREGAVIGYLHRKRAELALAKAEIAAKSVGAIKKAKAQIDQATSVVARNSNMVKKDPYSVAREDQEKAIAELNIANALLIEAGENNALAKAERDMAKQQLEEHTIKAPFPGVVFERLKSPGESVRSGDPIVRMGNLDKLRVFAYIPLDYARRVKVGAPVEIRPRVSGASTAGNEAKPIRGAITFVDPQVQAVSETAIRIYADFTNTNHEVSPGVKVDLVISLDGSEVASSAGAGNTLPEAPPASRPVGTTSNSPELPPLPR